MRDSWIAILVAIGIILFGGWVYIARPDHKYRLTFAVETPNGIVSASNVMAVYLDGFSIGPIGGGVGMRGEATFLDLGEGRNIIAILAHRRDASDVDGMSYLAMKAFAATGQKVIFKDVKKLSGKVPLSGSLIPTLVSFTDLSDPKTAQVVDPDYVEGIFGKGYRLKEVSLEMLPVGMWPFDFGGMLGEPVTRGIKNRVPEILRQLRERERVMQVRRVGDPYSPNSGQFTGG